VRLGANQPRIGTFNERVVINALRRGRTLSQTDLAQVTGLALPTVAGIVRQLNDRGLIRRAGIQPVGQGRPRTLLALEPEARFCLGVHLDPTQVTVTLLDLSGAARSTHLEVGAPAWPVPARSTLWVVVWWIRPGCPGGATIPSATSWGGCRGWTCCSCSHRPGGIFSFRSS